MVSKIALVVLLTALLYASADALCPENAEYTSSAPCDYLCGVPCDFKGVTNICICREGYLKEPSTQQCVLEDQCTVAANVPVLRSDSGFTFSCFS